MVVYQISNLIVLVGRLHFWVKKAAATFPKSVPTRTHYFKGRAGVERKEEGTCACIPPMVGSLFSWKSSFTKRRTREDYNNHTNCQLFLWLRTPPPRPSTNMRQLISQPLIWPELIRAASASMTDAGSWEGYVWTGGPTFPTAASPRSTSFTLLLSFGAPASSRDAMLLSYGAGVIDCYWFCCGRGPLSK